jgi:hypothetical protein
MAGKNLQFKRMGILTIESGSYLFRNDHCSEKGIWAWKIEKEIPISDRCQTHKWKKLPRCLGKKKNQKSSAVLFDLDNQPRTVSYLPLLD